MNRCDKRKQPCDPSKTCNPKTGRCIDPSGKLAKQLVRTGVVLGKAASRVSAPSAGRRVSAPSAGRRVSAPSAGRRVSAPSATPNNVRRALANNRDNNVSVQWVPYAGDPPKIDITVEALTIHFNAHSKKKTWSMYTNLSWEQNNPALPSWAFILTNDENEEVAVMPFERKVHLYYYVGKNNGYVTLEITASVAKSLLELLSHPEDEFSPTKTFRRQQRGLKSLRYVPSLTADVTTWDAYGE